MTRISKAAVSSDTDTDVVGVTCARVCVCVCCYMLQPRPPRLQEGSDEENSISSAARRPTVSHLCAQILLKGQCTPNSSFTHVLVTATSMEAVVTFSNLRNCFGVLQRGRIPANATSTVEVHSSHVLKHRGNDRGKT